jgi:hypothetical protein
MKYVGSEVILLKTKEVMWLLVILAKLAPLYIKLAGNEVILLKTREVICSFRIDAKLLPL